MFYCTNCSGLGLGKTSQGRLLPVEAVCCSGLGRGDGESGDLEALLFCFLHRILNFYSAIAFCCNDTHHHLIISRMLRKIVSILFFN